MRIRITEPRTMDFAGLADGVRRNNVGVAGISLQADVRFADARVEFVATGQSFPLTDKAPADGWCQLTISAWDTPEQTTLAARAAEAPKEPPQGSAAEPAAD